MTATSLGSILRADKRNFFFYPLMVVTIVAVWLICSSFLDTDRSLLLLIRQSYSKENEMELNLNILKKPVSILSQDDPRLIQVISKNYLFPPSKDPYNLKTTQVDPSIWQAKYVKELLKEKKNGFFIDCGAHNGEFLSNTLMFEKVYGWSGILIEADPSTYKELVSKHRKSWTVPACLSINNYPSEAVMKKTWYMVGDIAAYPFWKITNDPIQENKEGFAYKVQCFPLYSILLALNRTQIDYFSLDIEGNELNVLRTIPWDKVNITVITAEFNHVDEGKDALRKYMESQGYKVHLDGGTLKNGQNIDFVFYHPELLKKQISKNS